MLGRLHQLGRKFLEQQTARRLPAKYRAQLRDPMRKLKNEYAKTLIVVEIFRVSSKNVTSKLWFSHGLISKILV